MRLVERQEEAGATSGILEVFHAGAWGTLCEEDDPIFRARRTRFPEVSATPRNPRRSLQHAWTALPSGCATRAPACESRGYSETVDAFSLDAWITCMYRTQVMPYTWAWGFPGGFQTGLCPTATWRTRTTASPARIVCRSISKVSKIANSPQPLKLTLGPTSDRTLR